MAYRVVTPPTVEPISLALVKAQLHKDGIEEDELLAGYLSSAREHAELYTGLAIAPQTWEVALDYFPADGIELPGGVVSAVQSVTYLDENGDQQAIPAQGYALDTFSTPNWLLPAYGSEWPTSYGVVNSVRVRYEVGSTYVSPTIKAAILLTVGHLDANREAVSQAQTFELPMGVKNLLDPHRINMGV